jgi:hypothetical protein
VLSARLKRAWRAGCRAAYQEGWSRQDCTESGYEADDSAMDELDPVAAAKKQPATAYRITFPDSFHFFMDCFLELLTKGGGEGDEGESFLYTAGTVGSRSYVKRF